MKKIFNLLTLSFVLYILGNICYAQTTGNQQFTQVLSHKNPTDLATNEKAQFAAPRAEASLQFKFMENKNQWEKAVKYRTNVPNGLLYFKENTLLYTFWDADFYKHNHTSSPNPHKDETLKGHGVEMKFLGANENPKIETAGQSAEYYNFFLGNEPAKWASEVRTYNQLAYKNLYQGVDMQFYTQDEALKYEFIVAPNTDTKQIQWQYNGADAVSIESGNLKIQTSVHDFIEQHPYCYQDIKGQRIEVPAKFVLKDNILSYEFPEGYDKNHTLVIDPTLVFSTYSGSVSDNWGFSATFDEAGNLYAGGITNGQQIPLAVGAFDATFNGNWDIAIFKFNPSGSTMLYGTFVGGQRAEVPSSMIVNSAGNLIIMGSTGSNNFPVSATAFDTSFNGGAARTLHTLEYPQGADIYVTMLNATGTGMLASTYIGGNGNDGLGNESNAGGTQFPMTQNYGDEFRGEVNLDALGNVYVATVTRSTNFPVNSGAALGLQDGVIFSLSPTLSTLNWGRYVGGNQDDAAFNVKVANNGDVYICGGTISANFPTTAGAFQTVPQGSVEGFVQRYNSAGALQNSTLIATTAYDMAFMLDLDFMTNDVYVFGNTTGIHPISTNTFSRVGGGHFVYKLNSTLSTRILSTQFGVTNLRRPNITPTAFMVNDCGNIYISGWGGVTNTSTTGVTLSTTGLPVTSDAIRQNTDGDDFYLMILEKNARNLLYATFFGGISNSDGDHVDGGTSRFSRNGVIYHSICACRTNNVTVTAGSWSTINRGAPDLCNNAAFKIDLDPMFVDFTPIDVATNQPVVNGACVPVTVRLQNLSRNATVFQWDLGTFGTSTANQPPTITITTAGTYTFRLTASNPELCLPAVTVTKTITLQGGVITVSPSTAICNGQSTTLSASGGLTYSWSPATGLSATNIANPVASPTQTTTYTVTAQVSPNCTQRATVTVTVAPTIEALFTVSQAYNCAEFPLITIVNQSAAGGSYTWDFGNGQTSTLQNPPPFRYTRAGTYTIKLTTNAGSDCARTLERQIVITKNPNILTVTISPNQKICVGDSARILATGGTRYVWTPTTALNNSNVANPIANPSQTTTYTVRITDNLGCFKDTSLVVEVASRIDLDFDIVQEESCEPYPLLRIISRLVGGDVYTWNFGNGQTFVGQQPPPFRYTTDGTYTITVVGKNANCERQFSKQTIQRRQNLNDFYSRIRVNPRNPSICLSDGVQLSATGGVRYLWTPATGLSNNTISNPTANPSQTTTYNVRIFNERDCFVDSAVTVTVVPDIKADFELQVSSECGKNGVVKFINKSTGNGQYKWTLGDGRTLDTQNPADNSYDKSGEYEVILEIFNGVCKRTKSQKIVVENVIPPNVITPNGDGKNDRFVIDNARPNWAVEIYDRWGKHVFSSKNYQNDWGNDATNALYYYLLTSPEGKTCKGWVMVMRGND